MTMASGARLGAYEIVSPLGAGGMGQVYRARDTRLDRTVAIKVLLPELIDSPVARQRFEREARAIAALSHPHICSLFDVGHQDGTDFLVMEYLEGETLAARLERGPLSLDQVARYATEITDALARAHQQGIVHRDLKPANIMLTKAGAKLLDFGLAKAGATALGAAATVSNSRDRQLTMDGAIMGTLPYMAPELLEGKPADARSDIFAVGAVVYEMVTGQRAFAGASEAAVIGAILHREPGPMSRIQGLTPLALERTVKSCLAKDPDDRFESAHDLQLQFRWALEADSGPVHQPQPRVRSVRWRLAWVPGLVAIPGMVLAILWMRPAPVALPLIRFTVPGSVPSAYSEATGPAVSPDGNHLAFEVLDARGRDLILLRSINSLDARPVEGTEDGFGVFWSPDSRSFAFFAEGKLKTVSISGGAPTILCDAASPSGGSWGRNGIILFASGDHRIHSVPEGGGRSTPVTRADDGFRERHRWPSFIPDGRHFLYVAQPAEAAERPAVYVASLDSKDRTVLPDVSSRALYTAQGYLLFAREGTLSAAPFDTSRFRFTDSARPLGAVMSSSTTGSAGFSVSASGVLAVQAPVTASRLLWFNRNGKEEGVVGDAADYENVRISPDGRIVAAVVLNPLRDTHEIWLKGLVRPTATRLTQGQQAETTPTWSPDGQRLAYASGRMGSRDIYVKDLRGTADDRALLTAAGDQSPISWSGDGRFLSYDAALPGSKLDLWVLPTSEPHNPFPFVQGPANDCCGHFSPDGRWVAYMSDESGRNQVYVKRFPGGGPSIQISTGGGRKPRWRPDGKELFYLEESKVMAIDAAATTIGTHPARMLFETEAPILAWDVAARGDRFLLATFSREDAFPPITLTVNWPAALSQR